MKIAFNDSGKFQNKGIGDKEVIFRTMVTEIPKYNSYYDTVVELEGKFYAIGEGSIDTSVSKMAEIHRVCTLYAITQMFNNLEYGEDVYLVMGSPIQTFENADHKQQFIDFMKGHPPASECCESPELFHADDLSNRQAASGTLRNLEPPGKPVPDFPTPHKPGRVQQKRKHASNYPYHQMRMACRREHAANAECVCEFRHEPPGFCRECGR